MFVVLEGGWKEGSQGRKGRFAEIPAELLIGMCRNIPHFLTST